MKKLITIIILIIPSLLFADSLGVDVLPFGAVDLDLFGNETFTGQLDTLSDSLGFNVFIQYDYIDVDSIREFGEAGMSTFPQLTSSDDIAKFNRYPYAKIEAEERESGVRFYDCSGETIGDYWVSDYGADTLFGPDAFKGPCHPGEYNYLKITKDYIAGADTSGPIEYHLDIKIKIDTVGTGSDSTDIIAYVNADFHTWKCEYLDEYILDTLYAYDFSADDSLSLFQYTFSVPDYWQADCGQGEITIDSDTTAIAFSVILACTGARELSVDYIEIYDSLGYELVINDTYNGDIASNASTYSVLADTILGFYLAELPYLYYMPMGKIQDVLADSITNADWNSVSPIVHEEYYSWWFETVDSDFFTPYIYPYRKFIYNESDDSTSYFGYCEPNNPTDKIRELQTSLNYFAERCSLAYNLAQEYDAEFWPMLQSFDEVDPPDHRRPTDSEFLCETLIALAEGADAIIYWKYGISGENNTGLTDNDSSDYKTDLWYVLKDDINPYIKAIDETYLSLTWDDAYSVCYDEGFDEFGDILDSVYIDNAYGDPGPDSGWFHVGEYHDANYDYFMLVNRACSKDTLGTEADSISATVVFDGAATGSAYGNLIVDIAQDVGPGWTAIPDTSDVLYAAGSRVEYSANLNAGEGRLFKIIVCGSISGTVMQQSDTTTKIEDVTITVNDSPESTATISNGGYILRGLAPGSHDFTFSHPDYRDTTISANITKNHNILLNVQMDGVGVITGTVKAEHDTTITIDSAMVILDELDDTTYTDTAGYFEYTDVPVDTYSVSFSHDNYQNKTVSDVEVTLGDTTSLEVLMTGLGSISGTVVECHDTSTGIDSVMVIITETSDTTFTDDGAYAFTDIPVGDYYVTFTHDDYNSEAEDSVEVLFDSTTTVDICLNFPCYYVPGDANGDDDVIGSDLVYLSNYLRMIGPAPPDSCWNDSTYAWLYAAADANGTCQLTNGDVTRILYYLRGLAILENCPQTPPVSPSLLSVKIIPTGKPEKQPLTEQPKK
ncbi:MAG: hypothetical protein GY839_01510 [candidate division Zixibacteria bacterium]|nr:hypothetical protein [candidate division Zixibacteria bacterium]